MDKFFLLPDIDINNKIIKDLSMNFNYIKDVLLISKELYIKDMQIKRECLLQYLKKMT